jgi:hypothetical protein
MAISRKAVRGAQLVAAFFRREAKQRGVAMRTGIPKWNLCNRLIDEPQQELRFRPNDASEQRFSIPTDRLEAYAAGDTATLNGYISNLITEYYVNPKTNP